MDYEEWKPFYKAILKDFGFLEEKDLEAAFLLRDLVNPLPLSFLTERIKDKVVCVYGAGDSLERVKNFPHHLKITADGSTSYLIKRGVTPDVVVTDLDGRLIDIVAAHRRGSIIVLHAHGDNMDKLRSHASKFGRVIPTCQCRPPEGVYNFGGFTDGDRAVSMAAHLGARKVILYGMDFEKVGRYSFSADTPIKRKKLKWGKRLIEYLKDKKGVEIVEGENG